MLLSRQGERLLGVLDHLAHFADAFGALGLALVPGEDVARTRRARLDGRGDVTFAKAVTVADVQGRRTHSMRMVRYSSLIKANASRSHGARRRVEGRALLSVRPGWGEASVAVSTVL